MIDCGGFSYANTMKTELLFRRPAIRRAATLGRLRGQFGAAMALLFTGQPLQAGNPGFDWAIPLPGNMDYAPPVAADAQGNILVGSNGQGVTKLDPVGRIIWTTELTAPVFGLAVDNVGATYAVARADTNISSIASAPPKGIGSAVLAKFLPTGELAWIRRDGGANLVWPNSIRIGPDRSIFVGGSYSKLAVFHSTPLPEANDGAGFLAKYSDRGNLVWVQGLTGTPVLGIDAAGDVLLGFDSELKKLGPDGNVIWSRTVADVGGIRALTADWAGNVFISISGFDGFVHNKRLAKWSASGERLWEQFYGFTGSSGVDFRSLAANSAGECLVAVQNAQPEIDVGSFRLTTVGAVSVAVLKFSATGDLRWAIASQGVDPLSNLSRRSDARNPELTMDPHGRCYVAGCFYGTVRFGPVELIGRNYGSPFQPFVAHVFDPDLSIPDVKLEINRAEDGLLLTWPTLASGFVLQTTTSLEPPVNWTTVHAAVMASLEAVTVRVDLPQSPAFYRVVRP